MYIKIGKHYIPILIHEIEKARLYKVFADIDATNLFHQIVIGNLTSNILSVMTPWGLFRQKFLPGGVAPASGILQKIMIEVFKDCLDWLIVIQLS